MMVHVAAYLASQAGIQMPGSWVGRVGAGKASGRSGDVVGL